MTRRIRPSWLKYHDLLPAAIVIFFLLKFIYDLRRASADQYNIGRLIIDYNTISLAINYFQFGAVRRGLAGSVIYLSGIKLAYAPIVLHAVSLTALLAIVFLFLRKMTITAAAYLPSLIVICALLLFWSTDIGRSDILVAVVLAVAALALVDGQIRMAERVSCNRSPNS